MKKLNFSLAAAMLLSSSALAFASNAPANPAVNQALSPTVKVATVQRHAKLDENSMQMQKSQKASQAQPVLVNMYAAPEKSAKVVNKVDVTQNLVPFFRKQGWIKVGNPDDGNVGWVNSAEYHKAVNDSFHRNVQTMFIEVSHSKGLPVITAYKNGKKLSMDESKMLYKKIQKRQAMMNRKLRHVQKRMRRWYRREMDNMQSFFMPLPATSMMQPIVVIERDHMIKPKSAVKAEAKPEANESDNK